MEAYRSEYKLNDFSSFFSFYRFKSRTGWILDKSVSQKNVSFSASLFEMTFPHAIDSRVKVKTLHCIC